MEIRESIDRVKTTLTIDQRLLRRLRVRAARTGTTLTEVVEAALREGLSVIDAMRTPGVDEDEVLRLASEAVHEVRSAKRARRRG